MSTAHQPAIVHRRAMPEAYPQLIAMLEVAPGNLEAATKEVWNQVCGLEIDELDSNRYFAIGSALCHYAQTMNPVLTDSVRRQKLVKFGAEQIIAAGPTAFHTIPIQTVFERPMEAALVGRSEPERIVGDCLELRSVHPDALVSDLTHLEADILRPLRMGRGESYLANDLKSRALGAVTILDFIVSQAQTSRGDGHRVSSLPPEEDIALLRTPHTLMWLKQLAARVPRPYLQDIVDRNILFDTDENGAQKLRDIDWDAEQKIMEQRKAQDPRYHKMRTKKLACPAMHVTGMIDDNVALAIDMIDWARQISEVNTGTS